jgi:hypothetical protein
MKPIPSLFFLALLASSPSASSEPEKTVVPQSDKTAADKSIPAPKWIFGSWIPLVDQTKLPEPAPTEVPEPASKPDSGPDAKPDSKPEAKENSGMAILATLEMFNHCHLIIEDGKVTYFFSHGNKYNRTVSYKVVSATETEVEIQFTDGSGSWKLRKNDDPASLFMNWGEKLAVGFPLRAGRREGNE